MHAQASLRPFRATSVILAALVLAACGQGSGPDSIPGTLVPPPAPCDSINFEADCPQPGIVNFNGGATIVIDNPDKSGINTSDRVARMQKFPDQVFGGTLLDLGEPIDFSQGESYKVKVWSPRPVAVSFKLEEQGNSAGGLTKEQDHPGGSAWEELCFDFTGQNVPGDVVALTIIFDNGTLGQADTDPDNWTFYYDDITQVESCTAGPGASIIPDVALTGADPDLVIPDDYEELTAFGSGSVIDPLYADDETFSPVLSVFSGTGYGANVAQVGFIGFPAGFLTDYETVDFKVKGMPNLVIFVKLFDGVDALRLNLTRSDFSTDLGDGWYQVSIPVARFGDAELGTGIVFESDNTAQTQFRMLLTDVGFSGTGTRVPADAGIIPDVTLYDRDGTPDFVFGVDYTEISAFGSGADLEDDFRGDIDFRPAWSVTTGFGYEIWNAQLAYLGFAPGFAASYLTLDFKVKGLSGDVIRVKFLNDPDPPYVDIDVTTSAYSTALGNGWYQVSVPLTAFEGVATATGLLFETIAPAPVESFTYLLTDIGFSGEAPVDTTTSVGFEGDPGSYSFDNFGGGVSTVIANPDQSGINTTGQAVQMTRTSESNFGGSTLALPEGVDWSQGDIFRMKVWSQRPVPVLFKIEGSPPAERPDDHDGGGAWQELCFDFTGENAGAPVTGISIFFDLGVTPDPADDPDNWTFYYDEIQQSSAPCAVPPPPEFTTITFDDPEVNYELFDFGGNASVITNDPASGTNQVVQTVKSGTAELWAGTTVATLPGEAVPVIPLAAGNTQMSVRVYSPDAGIPVRLKIEDASDNTISVETEAVTTTVNAWETLTFDFADEVVGTAVFNPAATYNKISIFFNFGTDGATAGVKTYYFDDIAIGAGSDVTGIIPEVGAYVSDTATMNEDLGPPGGIQNFGSGAVFTDVLTDPDYLRVLQVESGEGYGAGVHVGFAAFTGYPAGFAQDFETLHFKVKGDAANLADFEVKFFAPDTSQRYDLTSYAGATDLGNGWIQVSIPLSDFAANIAVYDGFILGPFNGQAAPFVFQMTDIGFSADGGGGGSIEIALNGGFETGDFTGWTPFEATPGDQTVNTSTVGDTSSEGVFHLEINNTATGTNSLIKQERVGLGIVTPGTAWTVTFDARGSFGPGGVAFAQVFSETAGGNENCTGCGILGGAPLALNADPTVWTSFSFSGTAGPNTESLTLQLEAVTGGSNLANVFYDNISIVVGNGGG